MPDMTAEARARLEDGLTDHEHRHQKLLGKVAANVGDMIREAVEAAERQGAEWVLENLDNFNRLDGEILTDDMWRRFAERSRDGH